MVDLFLAFIYTVVGVILIALVVGSFFLVDFLFAPIGIVILICVYSFIVVVLLVFVFIKLLTY